MNFERNKDIEIITSKYVDHINSDLFTPLGRRLHSILVSESLSEGVRLKSSLNIKVEDFKSPIFVIGLPRSGTTNLHNLIINSFDTYGLRYWELSSPANLFSNMYLDEKIRRFKSKLGFLFVSVSNSINSINA